MNHPSYFVLNEYLDERLTSVEKCAIEEHLRDCEACCVSLEEIKSVFQSLGKVGDRSLPQDFTPAILTRLKKPRLSFLLKTLLSLQAGITLGILVLVARFYLTIYSPEKIIVHSFTQVLNQVGLFISGLYVRIPEPFFTKKQLSPQVLIILTILTILLIASGNIGLLKNNLGKKSQ